MDTLTQNARALRKTMTKEERRLWYEFLRRYPVRFLRQRPVDRYILDFYCAKAKLAVELDGEQHYESEGQCSDAERDATLATYGIMVLRIPNNEVTRNIAGVCERIDLEVRRRAPMAPFRKGSCQIASPASDLTEGSSQNPSEIP